MPNPFDTFHAIRAARRAGRKPVPVHIPARVRDNGAPSTRATDARDARLAESEARRVAREQRNNKNDDYFTYTRGGPRFTSTKR